MGRREVLPRRELRYRQARLFEEFTEIESGRRHTNRPQLLTALAECRKRRAVVLIDRLARNVAFISGPLCSWCGRLLRHRRPY